MSNDIVSRHIAISRQDGNRLTFLNGPSSEANEVLRFNEDGKVFVRGELVDDNKAIYEAFKEWLEKCRS